MIPCNISFLKPEEEDEQKIWLEMTQYTIAVRASYALFNTYRLSTLSLLEQQLLNREPDKNCGNYPLLDDAETDCIWGIHHYSESEIKDIERSVKRAELEYSGTNCTDTTTKHFDEKMVRQYVKDMQQVHMNTERRFDDAILDCYTAYMLRRGMLIHTDVSVLSFVVSTILSSELVLDRYYMMDPDEHINIAFYQRTGYNNTKKNIVVVSSRNTLLVDELFGKTMRESRSTNVKIIVVPEEQFYEEMATLRTSASRYTVVSKKFDSVMTLLSVFKFSLESKIFDQIDPRTFIQTNYIGLYGVEKTELNTLSAKDVYLLRVPGYSDNYYGVIGELLPLKCSSAEEVQTKLLISEKVSVDSFELVDKNGTPVSVLDGSITWEQLERTTDTVIDTFVSCGEKRLMDYPDVVSFGNLYQLKIKTNTDCFIRISCHLVTGTTDNPLYGDCLERNVRPIISEIHKMDFHTGFDARKYNDIVTPGFNVLYIPFCTNIKQLEFVKEWGFGCGELADLMSLYAVYHVDSKNHDLVRKKLLNDRIVSINVVSSSNINGAASTGWFYQDPTKECIKPSHQSSWYLRIELKEAIWVHACMGIQLHIEKDVIRMTSDRGCSYNSAQDVEFHLVPRKSELHHHWTIGVHKAHHKITTPLLYEELTLSAPLDLIAKPMIEKVADTLYTIRFTLVERSNPSMPLKVEIYRGGKASDRIQQYYKKRNLLNPPEWFAASSDATIGDDGCTVSYDINLDELQDAIAEHDIYVYIPTILVERNGNVYMHRHIEFMLDLSKV